MASKTMWGKPTGLVCWGMMVLVLMNGLIGVQGVPVKVVARQDVGSNSTSIPIVFPGSTSSSVAAFPVVTTAISDPEVGTIPATEPTSAVAQASSVGDVDPATVTIDPESAITPVGPGIMGNGTSGSHHRHRHGHQHGHKSSNGTFNAWRGAANRTAVPSQTQMATIGVASVTQGTDEGLGAGEAGAATTTAQEGFSSAAESDILPTVYPTPAPSGTTESQVPSEAVSSSADQSAEPSATLPAALSENFVRPSSRATRSHVRTSTTAVTPTLATTSTGILTATSAAAASNTGCVAPLVVSDVVTQDQEEGFLVGHNTLRAQYGADPVTWSDELASAAKTWASKCVFEHSKGAVGSYGENIAYSYGYPDAVSQAVTGWSGEATSYNWDKPGFSDETGHFTQMVWLGTTELGCAAVSCDAGTIDASNAVTFVVCEYSPPGNYLGEFPKNVLTKGTQPSCAA